MNEILIPVREFYLYVSISDFVTWFGEGDNDFSANEALQAVLDALGVTVDLCAWHNIFFEQAPDTGDVYLYKPSPESENVFALDMFRDATDQMDLVSVGVSCDKHCLPIIREKLRAFFEGASCQVHYQEANCSLDFRRLIDPKNYPRTLGDYQQNLHVAYG
jgi:hypothetical protein